MMMKTGVERARDANSRSQTDPRPRSGARRSYDWIDSQGRRPPQQLAELPESRAKERFDSADDREVARIVSAEPGRQLMAPNMAA